jgi:hypothetical protein
MVNVESAAAAGLDRGSLGLAAAATAAAGGWMSALWACAEALVREGVLALMPWDIRFR